MKQVAKIRGLSLVELMISLALGTVLTLAVIQVMVSNRVTNQFNQTVSEVQESGRFVITRLRNEIIEAGLYDELVGNIVVNANTDPAFEKAFVQNRPITIQNHFPLYPTLASLDGSEGASDTLVINLMAEQDCTGNSYGFTDEVFHVTNRYFVSGNLLRCQGFNGRERRGEFETESSGTTVTLMDNVVSFQVQYGLTAAQSVTDGSVIRYVNADQLANAEALEQRVVSIRIGLLMQSASELGTIEDKTFTVLDEQSLSTDEQRYGQVFTQTIGLRNIKNYVRRNSA